MQRRFLVWLVLATLTGAHAIAGEPHEREVAVAPDRVDVDWLVRPVAQKAVVYREERRNEIVLSNGLIRRTFRLAPNAATVGFDNLMTGEAILRGVKPEAVVRLHGVDCEVGGLLGQPNYAFLRPEWVDRLAADPAAMRFDRYEVGDIKQRFAWKRVRHAADTAWPPPGVELTLHFKATRDLAERLAAKQTERSELARTLLLEDNFERLDEAWRVRLSKQEGTTFSLEGRHGAVRAAANTPAFVERDLPAGVRVVQCAVDAGTDQGNSWGPGITLVWKDRVIKFYIRPSQKRLGVYDGRDTQILDPVDTSVVHHLRLRIDGRIVVCESSRDGLEWTLVHRVALDPTATDPIAVRIGKTSETGGDDEYPSPDAVGRCVVGAFRAFGDLTDDARALVADQIGFVSDVTVAVHYEMYDGIPLLAKWVTVHNGGDRPVHLDTFTSDILAAVEYESVVDVRDRWAHPNLHVESDYAYFGMDAQTANRTVHWVADPQYATQVNYLRRTPNLLEVKPPIGPDVDVAPAETFETFRTYTLVHDSTDRTRKGLAVRRMYRTIAPWVTENPLIMHVRSADPTAVRKAIDQCAEVGFEMVVMTFGSGFDIENDDPEYLAQIKALVDYANARGIELGGYSLLASRSIGPQTDVIDAKTGRPGGAAHGSAPCLGSAWGRDYFRKLYRFYEATGMHMLEHDGSYAGDICASCEHPGHRGLGDSQWTQWKTITGFYEWCRARGIYLNVPDYYFLSGSNKVAMGYRETNWSLPREEQLIHTRQNIYDGTWTKTPSMGWMFVPLTEYHGGGAAATVEPLDQHRDHYRQILLSNLGAGVQAVYRGPRLYDTERTCDMVKEAVDWFKRYRAILESDIIQTSSRRADGRDLDWLLHANPTLDHRGMLVVYNPLDHPVTRTIDLDIYHTGLTERVVVRGSDGQSQAYNLTRGYRVHLPVTVQAGGVTWMLLEAEKNRPAPD